MNPFRKRWTRGKGWRRRLARAVAAAALWSAVAPGPRQSLAADSGGHAGLIIPEVHSTAFAGNAVDLPKMLTGKVGVLVIGFSRESREPVAEWGKRLTAEYNGSATVLYYEMPMLAEVPRVLRGVVVRTMRKDVPEPAQARFVPLIEDEARWKDLVGYGRPEDAYVVVIDGAGKVSGREHGPATEASFAEVKARVASAEAGSATARP